MDRWRQYLFENHPESQLRAWALKLHVFRFCRAYGGHANDSDSLDAVFPYNSREELLGFCALLGIELVHYSEQPPQPEPGVSYRGDVYDQFPSLIPNTQWIRQLGHCLIAGQKAFAWCNRGEIRISIGFAQSITDDDVSSAQLIEAALARSPLQPRDPPNDNEHCICPKYYSNYFG